MALCTALSCNSFSSFCKFCKCSSNAGNAYNNRYVIAIILLWYSCSSLTYYLFLDPSGFKIFGDHLIVVIVLLLMAILSLFSPLAGLLADVIYGRFALLKCSTYFMIMFMISGLVSLIVTVGFIDGADTTYYVLTSSLKFILAGYYVSRVVFVANIVQFGTDQLRDAPTGHSVVFIYMFLWSDSFTQFIANFFSRFYHHDIVLNSYRNIVILDSTKVIFYEVLVSISIILLFFVLHFTQKNSAYFVTDCTKGNPYKLVCGVIKFSLKHKQPLRRSSFTYCEDERPSRLDFGKQLYGGPFTTEEVEDVKVLFNILKILISLGPVFLLEYTDQTIFNSLWNDEKSSVEDFYTSMFLQQGLLSPLVAIAVIPVIMVTLRKPCSKWFPNVFKRMGLSITILIMLFIVYILYKTFAVYNSDSIIGICTGNNSSSFNWNYINIPYTILPIARHVLSSLHKILLLISVFEFICCQSPQHMKGLIFGLFYFIKSFFELISIVVSYIVQVENNLYNMFYCTSGYFLLNIFIGVVCLFAFVIVARKYAYRKRDDICNIYKFAEDYYSKLP